VTGLNYWTLARAVIPFVLVEIVVLGVLVFVPEITLLLPRAMGLWN
jgi:TRAP-type C4-dicarboxylate transport system permease large subunit